MRTPIDSYIDDALDYIPPSEVHAPTDALESVYTSSRDLDDVRTGGITKDVAFNRHSFGAERQLPDSGVIQVGTDGLRVELVQGIDEVKMKKTLSMALAAGSGQPIEDADKMDWQELLRGGIQTALESQVVVFAIYSTSRVNTHQLVRTRKAAYHQQGQRGLYHGDHPEFRFPESVWAKPEVRPSWFRAIYYAHEAYRIAAEFDVSYQDARYILPNGCTNFILCEYPLRTFLETYAYRACQMFQWEIVDSFRKMKEAILEDHAWMEPYIKISCEQTHGALDQQVLDHRDDWSDGRAAHACTYQGHEQVESQCDFPWARESNRTFRSEKHEIKTGGK